MPNARTVDERVVEMRLDNKGFEEGAHKTISTLEKLERALHLKSDSKAFDDMTESVSKFDANPMVSGLEKIKEGFSALEIVGMRVISNLTDSVYNFATRTIKSFTIDPIMQGMGKFGEKTTAVSTLTAQGYELEKVNKLMEDLNWFTDETSYNFTDMVGNIAKFTATGQDLEQSVTAMEGIALWAAVSGQNATKASMAMYQLSQAMGKGALKYDDYKSIQNASMDTQEFRKQAAAAAVELGYLKQVADGLWETTDKTAKAGQSFDLAGLFSSDALSRTSWFTSDVMMNVFNKYSKAVKEIQRYMEDMDIDTASEAMTDLENSAKSLAAELGITLDEAFQRLGYDLDEFSLKALKAGQNARTWGDVVDSVKDAVSTGWMNTFEHLFGDAETATKFWTDIANRFYDIFAVGGETRNSILSMAFGKSDATTKGQNAVKNLAGGWERFEKRLESSGKTMEDFEKALYSVADRAAIDAIENFNGVDDALKKGGISADLFRQAMDALFGSSDDALTETDAAVQHATHSLQEMREVAIGVLRGDYGNGEERRKMLEEMGYDYELMQAMAGDLKWGGLNMSDEQLIEWMELYYQYNNLGSRLGANTFAEYLEQTSQAADDAAESIETYEDLYDAVVHGITEVDEASQKAMTGGEYFRQGLLNLIDAFMAVQEAFRGGFTKVFGDEEHIANGLFRLVKGFHDFTLALQPGEGMISGLTTVFSVLLSVVKAFGTAIGFAGKIGGGAFRGIMAVAEALGSAIGAIGDRPILENFGAAFRTIFESFGGPLTQVSGRISELFDKFRDSTLPVLIEKIGDFLERASVHALAFSQNFKGFMESTEVANTIGSGFDYLLSLLRAVKAGFQDFDLIGTLEDLYHWIQGIFFDVEPESSGVVLALEEMSDAVEPITRGFMGDTTEIQNRIKTFFETVKNSIHEQLQKISFEKVLNTLKIAAMTVFLAKVAELVEQTKNLTKNIASIPEAFAGTIEKAGDVLTAFKKNVTAEAYIKIATAIGILAGALLALSFIPQDKLTHAATVIGLLMLVMSAIMKHMSSLGKFGDNSYNIGNALKVNVFNGLAAKLFGLAMVIASIAAALAVVRKVSSENPKVLIGTMVGLIALVGLLGLFVTKMAALPKFNGGGAALTFLSLALSIQMLMLPMAELALFARDKSLNMILGAVLGVIGLIGALGGVVLAFNHFGKGEGSSNVMKMAGSMALVALSIGLLIVPLAALAALPGGAMGKALAALLGISAIIAIMATAFSLAGGLEGSGNIIKIAAGMALFAVAMNLMIPVLGAFAGAIVVLEKKYSWEKIKDNLLPLGGLALVLIAFAAGALLMGTALNKLGSGMLKIAGSFALFSVALLGLSFALGSISEAFPKFVDGLISVGKSIRDKDGAKNFIWGAVAFGLFAVSIAGLVKSLKGLFTLGNVGAKFSKFSGALSTSIGGMLKNVGKAVIDHMPSMLQLLGSIVVLAALYLLDIIPQMTEIAVEAFTQFFNSLAASMEARKGQFVDSITSIVHTVFDVVRQVISNVWDEASFAEKLFTATAVMLILASRVSTAMIGTNGAGGILGAFTKLTGGATAAAGTMAATTTATMSSLFWWILGIAALIYAVYSGIQEMDRNEKAFDDQYFEGHSKDVEGYLHAIENAKAEYEKAFNDWKAEDEAFLNGTSEKTLEEVNGMMTYANTQAAALEKYKAQLREYLGLTTKEFNAELEAAGGDYSQMESVKQKLEEIKTAAEETSQAVSSISFEGSYSKTSQKEQALEEVRTYLESVEQEFKNSLGASGEEGGAEFLNQLHGSITGADGTASLLSGGEFSADQVLNGIGSEAGEFGPDLGLDTVYGYVSGIYKGDGILSNAGSWMYSQVDQGVRSRGRIQSPSREMMTIGEYTVDGLVLGILNQSSDLTAAGDQLADNLITTVSDAMSQVAVVASEGFEISPRVSPVINSAELAATNSKEEYAYWQDVQRTQEKLYTMAQDQRVDAAMQIDRMHSLWDDYAIRAEDISGTVEYSIDNSRMNDLVGDISNKVDNLGQQIANMRVVLDSGRLVGGISSGMDRQLGVMATRKGRGN